MGITVQQPIGSHRIVTDLNSLRETIVLADRINHLETADGMTETEAAAARDERETMTARLRELAAKVDESTITIRLRGMRSTEWNMDVMACTRMVDGKPVKDGNKLLMMCLPGMVESIVNHDGNNVTMTEQDIKALVESLADTQAYELLQTMQTLNSPATSLPKDVTSLLQAI